MEDGALTGGHPVLRAQAKGAGLLKGKKKKDKEEEPESGEGKKKNRKNRNKKNRDSAEEEEPKSAKKEEPKSKKGKGKDKEATLFRKAILNLFFRVKELEAVVFTVLLVPAGASPVVAAKAAASETYKSLFHT